MNRIYVFLVCLVLAGCHVDLGGHSSRDRQNRDQKPGVLEFAGNYYGTCSIITPSNASPNCHFTLSVQAQRGVQTIRLLVHGRDEYWFSFALADGLNISAANQVNVDGVMMDLNPGYDIKSLDPKIVDGVLVFNVTSETKLGPQQYSFKLETHKYGTQIEIKDKISGIYLTGSTQNKLPSTNSPREIVQMTFAGTETASVLYGAERGQAPASANEYRGVRIFEPRAMIGGTLYPMFFESEDFCQFLSGPGQSIYTGDGQDEASVILPAGAEVATFKKINEGTEFEYLSLEKIRLSSSEAVANSFSCSGGTF